MHAKHHCSIFGRAHLTGMLPISLTVGLQPADQGNHRTEEVKFPQTHPYTGL